MPLPASPFCKLLTAPCTAAALLATPSESLDHVALFNFSVKQSTNDIIVAVHHSPVLASALLGCISAAKALPIGAANHTCFISTINLVFADQADFLHIAKQQGLFDALSSLIQSKTLDQSVGDTSAPAKAFFSFANAYNCY
ncbi:hypothetical protein J132_00197 [Termitomyces sp. J132]|nr:hypothetical protein J132_00197 [Termitomyces sp. J132]